MHNVECLSETSYMAIAIVVWCVVLCAVFAPQIVCVIRELTKRTRDSLASSSFLFLMVGIAIVYAGGKNTLVLHTNGTSDVEYRLFSSANLESAVEYTNKLDGCVFAGWSRSEHGDTNWIEYVEANLKANCPTSHLYAIWVTNDCYAIAFDPGEIGGEWTMPRQQIKTNQVAKLNPCQFSPSGTNFLYWVHGSRIYDDGVLIFNLHNPDQNHDQDQSRVLTFKAMWEVQQ